jgi:hypothetical protein
VTTHFEYETNLASQRLADLMDKTAELERELSDARVSLERELAASAFSQEAMPGPIPEQQLRYLADMDPDYGADGISGLYPGPSPSGDNDGAESGIKGQPAEWRTDAFVSHGRRSAYSPGFSRGQIATGSAVAAVLVTILVLILSRGGASWPSSVATVQSEAARACQNSDVQSEPSQVNFACAKATRQVLSVFALMTSGNRADFTNTKTGRVGLEPITPAQGGEVAWSLNLHHPYRPYNPIDSLEVAARAINNIVGGATLTSANGKPVVQPGLESDAANCLRYTGSAAVTSRAGFPRLCAKPVANPAGQAALVADIYQKWIVGAGPRAAQDAAVLFENFNDPGNPQVQAILQHLPKPKL